MTSYTYAAPTQRPFPNIPFEIFSNTIQSTLGPDVSLATVLAVLFTLIENPDLLNLHFRQQHPEFSGENKVQASGWIMALINTLTGKLGDKRTNTLFLEKELNGDPNKKTKTQILAKKLDKIANSLTLSPYDSEGQYRGKLLPVSRERIEPAYAICPISFTCGTLSCQGRSLFQSTLERDIPKATLIKGHIVHQDVPVLTGKCRKCGTLYLADHERFLDESTIEPKLKRVYLNSAKYLKIGQSLWVDRVFSISAVNAMYNFHSSPSAYAEYWNNTFGTQLMLVSRACIWQAFVQQSIRNVAEESKIDVELDDALNIKEVTRDAFSLLGEGGIIRAADKHTCEECTQDYKKHSEVVFNNPAAVVGIDATGDNIPALEAVGEETEVDLPEVAPNDEIAGRTVNMVVLDGVVMGPQVNNIVLLDDFY